MLPNNFSINLISSFVAFFLDKELGVNYSCMYTT